jgi:hypothetical protein
VGAVRRTTAVWLTIGFAALGLLVGNLVGLTSESVVTPLLGLLFTFMGSSILVVLNKLNAEDRKIAGKAVLALASCCLVGVYLGIALAEYRLLTPGRGHSVWASSPQAATASGTREQKTSTAAEPYKYLRSDVLDQANAVDIKMVRGELTLPQAYEQMYALARSSQENIKPEGR